MTLTPITTGNAKRYHSPGTPNTGCRATSSVRLSVAAHVTTTVRAEPEPPRRAYDQQESIERRSAARGNDVRRERLAKSAPGREAGSNRGPYIGRAVR